MDGRTVEWEGFLNARDLGGLPTVDGRTTRRDAVLRSEHPEHLTDVGWRQLRTAGLVAVVSLHTDGVDDGARAGAVDLDRLHRSGSPAVHHVPVAVEDGQDPEFLRRWGEDPTGAGLDGGLLSTALYWRDALARWPHRCAAAVAAVADAPEGPALVHRGRGCDRTGLVVALLLTLVGVAPDVVAADHALSAPRLRPRHPDLAGQVERVLAAHGLDPVSVVVQQLDDLDVAGRLRGGGLTAAQERRVRERLLGSP